MPPKTRVTREMILDAAFQLVREEGTDALNARAVAQRLDCSTQPVMYNFSTIEQLRQEVYTKADAFHSEWLMQPNELPPMLSIGINYIRFARQEQNLFRFLFHSGQFSGFNIDAMISDPAAMPLLEMVAAQAGCTITDAQGLFRKMFIMAHGYASLLASNALDFDEAACIRDLQDTFRDFFPNQER